MHARTVIGSFVAVMAAAAALAPSASAETTAVPQYPCGFYEQNGQAYYGHCDEPPPTWVIIHVDYLSLSGKPDRDWCVPPGSTHLGAAWEVNNAWWTGRLC